MRVHLLRTPLRRTHVHLRVRYSFLQFFGSSCKCHGQHLFVDAAAILRERAHTEDQIARLAGELGKDLKLVAENEQTCSQSNEQTFGSDRCQVGWYHRVRQASLIEDVLASFKQRSLYQCVVNGQPNSVAARRQNFLDLHGRGRNDRSRSVRRN